MLNDSNRFHRAALLPMLVAALLLGFTVGCDNDDDDDNGGNGGGNPTTDQVAIQNFVFSPANITVSTGTTVTWTNRDAQDHTVTSGTPSAPTGLFNSGNLGQNATFSFTFNTAGSFPYFCALHPGMAGTVTVQ